MKQNTEVLNEGIKQESLLARDFEFAFYKKVPNRSYMPDASIEDFDGNASVAFTDHLVCSYESWTKLVGSCFRVSSGACIEQSHERIMHDCTTVQDDCMSGSHMPVQKLCKMTA